MTGREEQSTQKRNQMLDSLFMAFSMYSRIPVPRTQWSEAGMRYVLCFFPMVGAVIGAVMAGFCFLARKAGLGEVAFSCVGTALPLLLTGGIHMDGFLDVTDARSSCQPWERKLEILKDPHTGAFAMIGGGVYLLLYSSALSELGEGAVPAIAGIFVMERALSGWSVVSFPKAKRDGLVSTFADGADKKAVQVFMAVWGLMAAGFMIGTGGAAAGALAVGMAFLVFGWYYRMSVKEFGGTTGDLAGYFLQLCELGMLGVLAWVL